MQIFIIAMVIALFAFGDAKPPDAPAWQLAAAFILPKLAIGLLYFTHCAIARRHLTSDKAPKAMRLLDWSTNIFRWATLFSYTIDLRLGFIFIVRNALGAGDAAAGDWILIDEIIVTLPPLLMITWGWWCYYPIDRRFREVAILRQVDEGEPVYPIWSREQYLLSQWRHQIAIMAVPLLFLLAWSEIMNLPVIQDRFIELPQWWAGAVMMTGVAAIFLFAPLMIRMVWDTVPLPHGELRQRLEAMCQRHKVGVRQLLIWRTFGGMINACVMGVLAPLRYIMLTDALLDTMRDNHVEAVMAHEIAHIRKHHMFWMLIIAAALIMGFTVIWTVGILSTLDAFNLRGDPAWLELTDALGGNDPAEGFASLLAVGCWLMSFGWISRRFERQADTFAVQHLVQVRSETGDNAGSPNGAGQSMETRVNHAPTTAPADKPSETHRPLMIDQDSVHIMTSALGRVAVLNHIPLQRKSWRHGSIAWRQQYLRQLVGRPVDNVSIDYQIRLIKAAGALLLLGLIAIEFWAQQQ